MTSSGNEFQALVMRLEKNLLRHDFVAANFFSFFLCPRVDLFVSSFKKSDDVLYIPLMYLKHSIMSPLARRYESYFSYINLRDYYVT